MVQVTLDRSNRVKVVPILAAGIGVGMAWGIAIRAWMRLISESPEFTWSGTIFIVTAGALAGMGSALGLVARRNRWRFGKMAAVVGGVLFVPLGAGAGSILLATVVLAAVAIGRPRIRLPLRLVVAASVGLVSFVMVALAVPVAVAVTAIVAVPLVMGYRTRLLLGLLALLPMGFVVVGVLTSDLPLWQRLAGAALYPMLVTPVLLWFSRTITPIPVPR